MASAQQTKPIAYRDFFKPVQELDRENVLAKKGTVADVVAQIRCDLRASDDRKIQPGEVDIELSLGGHERALRLGDDWAKIASLIDETEDVELAVASHLDGGV